MSCHSQVFLLLRQIQQDVAALCAKCGEENNSSFPQVKRKAESGDVSAQLCLSGYFSRGYQCRQSDSLSAIWVLRAAEQDYAYAMVDLAMRYASGEGVNKNLDESNKWIRKAAQLDSKLIPLLQCWNIITAHDYTKFLQSPVLRRAATFGAELYVEADRSISMCINSPIENWTQQRQACAMCGQHTKSVCGRCHQIRYCSRECQKKDWSGHSRICQKK